MVCSGCSQKKAYLHYLQKHERICESCHKEYLKECASKSVGKSWCQCYMLSGNSLFSADEVDGGSKNSSPKPPKKQESAPAGVLNVSILHCYDELLALSPCPPSFSMLHTELSP